MVIVNHGSSANTLPKVKTGLAQAAKMQRTQVDASSAACMPEVSSIEILAGGMIKIGRLFQAASTFVVKARVKVK